MKVNGTLVSTCGFQPPGGMCKRGTVGQTTCRVHRLLKLNINDSSWDPKKFMVRHSPDDIRSGKFNIAMEIGHL